MKEITEMYQQMGISPAVYAYGEEALSRLRDRFDAIDQIAEYNQAKVLAAFRKNRVAATCFAASTGYGYNDEGRDKLEQVYADVFHTEAALVRPHITCGTHALTIALSANLLPGDELLSPVGLPYDTLQEVIGIRPSPCSLAEYGVTYSQVDLLPDGSFDYEGMLMIILVLAFNVALAYLMRNLMLKKSDFNTMIVCTMGVEMIMNNLVTLFASATPRDFALIEKRIFITQDISIGSIQLLCFGLSLFLLFAFQAFLQKTWMGKSIRAVVQNNEVATTMGIRSERIMDVAFEVSFVLIGIASMLLALLNQISPTFGTPFQSKAFMVCVLAGIGNLGGTFFSGIIVGVVTALIGFVVGTEYLNPITYALFVLVLLVRPNGLFTKASSVARKL